MTCLAMSGTWRCLINIQIGFHRNERRQNDGNRRIRELLYLSRQPEGSSWCVDSFSGWHLFTKSSHRKIQNIKSGGHGQSALDIMDRHGIDYDIVDTYPNGVRVGNIPSSRDKAKRTGSNMAWFPSHWTVRDIVRAGEHISRIKANRGVRDGETIWGVYKGVRVGVIKTNGQIASIFPDSRSQPGKMRRR